MRSLSGQVGIQKITKTSGTYLYLWIPGQFMAGGRGARYSLKLLDTPANYAKADLIRRQVQIDLDLNLLLFVVASKLEAEPIEIDSGSFRGYLHPNLFRCLTENFSPSSSRIFAACDYFSGSDLLKCAVNPQLPCEQCPESTESLIKWL